ncbi:MAG TPA: VOC family protein [Planctomycetota bacterium]|nr:VOC family protein [Planctomycetota bacterium]
MTLRINDLKAYVPAKDYELSKRFYAALGFRMSPGWGDSVDFELGGAAFRLQNYYVKDWANNFMMVLGVDDVEKWHERALHVVEQGEFKTARTKPPEVVDDGSRVFHVWDPSGVLLVFVQSRQEPA